MLTVTEQVIVSCASFCVVLKERLCHRTLDVTSQHRFVAVQSSVTDDRFIKQY